MGHHSPSHQWDLRRRILFLLNPARARGTDISPKVLHKHLLFRRWATSFKAWVGVGVGVGVGTKVSRPVLQGPRGVSTLWYQRLRLQISLAYRVCFRSHKSVV